MNKFFLFDRTTVNGQRMTNAQLQVCPAVKDTEHGVMFTEGWQEMPAKPWEIRYDNGYPNVIYNPELGKYQCFYTLFTADVESRDLPRAQRATRDYVPTHSRITSMAYAESVDGIHWEKPNLGLVNFEGSTQNNLLFRYAHGTGVMRDETDPDSNRRYKMVTKVEYLGAPSFMAVNFSPDGIHWGEMIPWPEHNPAADSHNFPFRDPADGKYKLITRIWQSGVRVAAICESDDFLNWTYPKEILRYQGFENQVYSMPTFLQDGLYLGLASVFHEGDRSAPNFDTVDLELTYGKKADRFDVVAPGQYVIDRGIGHYPDGDFDCGCIYSAAPIEIDGTLWLYYMGGNGQHTNYRETSLGRASIQRDKYAYYCQKREDQPGVVITQRFVAFEDNLSLLADIESEGTLEVALCDRNGSKIYPGYDFSDCQLTQGENGWLQVKFAKPLTEMGDQGFALYLRFTKTKLFAVGGDVVIQYIRG